MGIIWRSIMPLLSTLAALVIIVHSLEEETDQEFRYHVRPRGLKDTVTPHSEEVWRPIDAEPLVHQTTQQDVYYDNVSPEEQPKRRRPVRKRRRRPLHSAELEPQERRLKEELPTHYSEEEEIFQTTEQPRRRRKRPDIRPMRWVDEGLEEDRPLKRRQRKKRPRQEMSEFNIHQENGDIDMNDNHEHLSRDETHRFVDNEDKFIEKRNFGSAFSIAANNEDIDVKTRINEEIPYDDYEKVQRIQDKSLSEFSTELMMSQGMSETENLRDKSGDKSVEHYTTFKAQAKSPIDPKTLKDLLKRSNGTSLSEILQQNNLSLTDLLNGKENAISALKPTYSLEDGNKPILEIDLTNHNKAMNTTEIETVVTNFEVYNRTDTTNTSYVTTTVNPIINDKIASSKEKNIETTTYRDDVQDSQNNLKPNRNQTTITTKRRFPVGIRRKLRMKPAIHYKAQLSRDIIPANSPKHLRNSTKLQEWKETVPLMVNTTFVVDLLVNKTSDSELTTSTSRETILLKDVTTNIPVILTTPSNFTNKQAEENKNTTKVPEIVGTLTLTLTEKTNTVTSTETVYNVSQKPKVTPALRALPKNVELRRQALNNRLKKKRLKQKDSTSESSMDTNKDLFGMTNLVSATEFIAKAQTPKKESPTTLEDIPVTEITTKRVINKSRSTRINTTIKPSSSTSKITTTTEDTAKIEIEEILNDTLSSLKLAKILKERNMTLKELVQLRERGSSHVHLADIFHNASKEPNPPEPFLSKSLLEPISRETYPLRALLEANLHDPTGKATTIDPSVMEAQYLNIPVVMDFGNNVNENGETLGIMSLFNKVTEDQDNNDQKAQVIKNSINKDQNGTVTPTTIRENVTNIYDIIREGRTLDENYQDMVNWSDVLELLQKENNNETKSHDENPEGVLSTENVEKYLIDEVLDGDSLIILDNQPQSNEFDINTASRSDESLEANMHERSKILTQTSGILNNMNSNTKSVTVAIAGIVGLSMVLFLLTYAVFKWRQQRKLLHKKNSVCGDRIPTPIFESRKGNKIHSSSRSLSPMITPSNIYTMSTLDSHNERDSPDYMWDSLRKPFQ